MLTIWGRANSINVQKVMWTVGELGLGHTRIDAGGAFGGLDTDEYAARNPHRRVPVIDDDGVIVWESNAIVRYLCARHAAGTLWATDPAERAMADRWMDWQAASLVADLATVRTALNTAMTKLNADAGVTDTNYAAAAALTATAVTDIDAR